MDRKSTAGLSDCPCPQVMFIVLYGNPMFATLSAHDGDV